MLVLQNSKYGRTLYSFIIELWKLRWSWFSPAVAHSAALLHWGKGFRFGETAALMSSSSSVVLHAFQYFLSSVICKFYDWHVQITCLHFCLQVIDVNWEQCGAQNCPLRCSRLYCIVNLFLSLYKNLPLSLREPILNLLHYFLVHAFCCHFS